MNPHTETVAALNSMTVEGTAGQCILNRASIQLHRGEVTCLVGPSGSGKTTIGLLFMGLLPAGMQVTEGDAKFKEMRLDPNQPDQYQGLRGKKIAIIFQDPFASLNPLRRCGPQVEDPLKLHGEATGIAAKSRVLDQFTLMGFDDPDRIYKSFPNQLSGGQRQRVVLALATILKPQVLIADEPTASLDTESQRKIVELLKLLSKEYGTAVLLISHDVGLVRIGDHFVAIRDGVLHNIDRIPLPSTERRRNVESLSAPLPLLEVSGLTKLYPRTNISVDTNQPIIVLKDVSLTVGSGEIVGIF